MIRKESINKRFFEALDHLLEVGSIPSYAAFCRDTQYDPSNLNRLKREPGRELPLPLLAYLVEKHNVSADRILTGKGKKIRASDK